MSCHWLCRHKELINKIVSELLPLPKGARCNFWLFDRCGLPVLTGQARAQTMAAYLMRSEICSVMFCPGSHLLQGKAGAGKGAAAGFVGFVSPDMLLCSVKVGGCNVASNWRRMRVCTSLLHLWSLDRWWALQDLAAAWTDKAFYQRLARQSPASTFMTWIASACAQVQPFRGSTGCRGDAAALQRPQKHHGDAGRVRWFACEELH